jgi:hypothetical protein
MGIVYLASSPADDVVALKLVRSELAEDQDFRRRFKSEVATARRVGGVCTAKVRDADVDADRPWVVTEFVAGPNLADLVDRHGPLPPDQQRALALGLTEALVAIHRVGIVHRDLKPNNVLCSPAGPKVIDIGIAQTADATRVTLTGEVIGSPAWMSPEQVEGGAATSSADIFSLGLVLAFAATGRPPFGKGQFERVMWRVLNEPPDLGEDGSLDAELRPLVVRMLAKDSAQRPSAEEALDTLSRQGDAAAATVAQVLDRSWVLPAGEVVHIGDAANAEENLGLQDRSIPILNEDTPAPTAAGDYPFNAELEPAERVARWRPLTNWVATVPLLVWLVVLTAGSAAVVATGYVAILVTGRLPDSFGDYLMGVLRYRWRVSSFLFGFTDRYPGYGLNAGYVDPGDRPAVVYSAHPLDRQRSTVLVRGLLIVPHLVALSVTAVAALVLLALGWWGVLIRGQWPRGPRSWLLGWLRWALRVRAYGWLIVDQYPPFWTAGQASGQSSTAATAPGRPDVRLDPKEVTGPPWPRLVAVDGFAPPRPVVWPVLVGALLLAGGATLAVIGLSTPRRPATVGGSDASRALESKLVAAPSAFAVARGTDAYRGPISARTFDDYFQTNGAATGLGFLTGYGIGYQNPLNGDSIQLFLLRFVSPQAASRFTEGLSLNPDILFQADPVIPGGRVYDSTTADSTDTYQHGAIASKGSTVMVVDYAGGNRVRPILVNELAQQQYERMA